MLMSGLVGITKGELEDLVGEKDGVLKMIEVGQGSFQVHCRDEGVLQCLLSLEKQEVNHQVVRVKTLQPKMSWEDINKFMGERLKVWEEVQRDLQGGVESATPPREERGKGEKKQEWQEVGEKGKRESTSSERRDTPPPSSEVPEWDPAARGEGKVDTPQVEHPQQE